MAWKTMSKKSIFLCQACGWKRVCDPGSSGLLERKNDAESPSKFRCPGCGRGIVPRKFPDPQAETERRANEDRMKADNEAFLDETAQFQNKFIKEMSDDQPEDDPS